MRFCVFGAGAVGANFAVRLAEAGHTVSVIARGAALDAIRDDGLTLISAGEERRARPIATSDPTELGSQDVVLVTVKAHDLTTFAERGKSLLHADTAVVFAQNGIPWWYGDGLPKDRRAPPDLSFLDSDDLLRSTIGLDRTLGGVIYSSNDQVAPGVIVNNSPQRNRLLVGEIDDRDTERVRRLRQALNAAGIESPAIAELRARIWEKLVANLSVSILSFLTASTSREVFDDVDLRSVVTRLGEEGAAIAAAYGYAFTPDPKGPAPGHKSSMLQDHERGRRPETTALLDAPLCLAHAAGVPTPTLEAVAALVRRKLRDPVG